MSHTSLHSSNLKVIINADDFGITLGVNKAIIQLAKVGKVTSTSVMTNMPYYEDVKKLTKDIGIGVHLNLTMGKPVLSVKHIPSLVNGNGYFYNFQELILNSAKRKISKKEVEAEFNAQIARLIDWGFKPDHINSHQSLLKYPFFFPIIKKVAKEAGIIGVRTYMPRKLTYKYYLSPPKTIKLLYLAYQKANWVKEGFQVASQYDSLLELDLKYDRAIEKLKDIFQNTLTEILEIIVHPGYYSEENPALGKYSKEREVELDALLSEELNKIIKSSHTTLISFKDIKK